jgi:hypothetical protein
MLVMHHNPTQALPDIATLTGHDGEPKEWLRTTTRGAWNSVMPTQPTRHTILILVCNALTGMPMPTSIF